MSRAEKPTVGILANPLSGRDVRRVAARADTSTPQSKRNQVARIAIGAVAAGARRVLVMREPFRVSTSAIENLVLDAELESLDVGARLDAGDTARAAEAMRKAGCGAIVVLGGDGTNRALARIWPDAPLVPLSTGTNNVFPRLVEPTTAGAAAGLVASGAVELGEVSARAKCVRVEIDGEPDDFALVDAAFLVDDHVGNLLPFEPAKLRALVLARAEPTALGMSPIGGLLEPVGAADEAGLFVACAAPGASGRRLLAPVSAGLYRPVNVASHRRIALGETIELRGPGVLAFDGDRERKLGPDQRARLRVLRDGPCVIDVSRALHLAAQRGTFLDRAAWHDAYDEH
ncbi:MAG TPA: NAD(+)/NADH kinase [Myxococcota bacterium]|nr:NAD(+)/NADH kinase [Myxococcota bacterium]